MVANETASPKRELSPEERFPVIVRGWYPVCFSQELRVQVHKQVNVYGREFVVFRTAEDQIAALIDRCPHRNVPLSAGRVCDDGTIECAYHGWRFAGDGACRSIPGLQVVPERIVATSTRAAEAGGIVWIWADPESEPDGLPALPEAWNDPRYTTIFRQVSAPASLFRTVENALDVPHTSVLHRGLFRSGTRQKVQVTVRRWHDRAEAEYQGERPPRGALAWVLALGLPKDQKELTVEHWDRFILPGTAQVEYKLGAAAHFVITAFARPVSVDMTELFVVASFRTSLPGRLVAALLEPLARLVFRQDQRILGVQSESFHRQGAPTYYSTVLDALGQEIWRLLKARSTEAGSLRADQGSSGQLAEPLAEREFELLA
jgi:phenylpropionate dioxygenase-like ring-hydroxylating dioxygenase large terminal subunit